MQTTDILNFIKSRRSIGNLVAPAPSQTQLEQAIEVALTAPDHKQLHPYRFVVLANQGLVKLGQVLQQAAIAQGETDTASLNKIQNLPCRAPMIIACVTDFKIHDKVPQFEQLLSAGAGVQNLLLALQAQGFATVWRTGLLANEPAVKAFFKVSDDNQVVGFVYVGSPATTLPPRPKIDVTPFIVYDNANDATM